jgi:hypothetical protein
MLDVATRFARGASCRKFKGKIMSQIFQPCCERVALEVTDAPRTDGANPSPDVIRCASCGSAVSAREITAARRAAASRPSRFLTSRLGLRRTQSPRKIETQIKGWL